eukprot:1547600-Ditylum_brightwellii.AAC.1
MVIGTSWIHKYLRRTARAFHDVLFVDATEGTNNEERPLLIVSVRILLMKQGKSFANEVKVVLTGGNWNEMAAVDESFKPHFKIAIRQRCGWHTVDRGWARYLDHVVSCTSPEYKEDFYCIKRTIQCWLHPWMKSSILIEDNEVKDWQQVQ